MTAWNSGYSASFISADCITTESSLLMIQNAFRAVRVIVLRPRRAWLMTRIAVWALIFSAAVRFRSLPSALQLLSPSAGGDLSRYADDEEIARAVQSVLGMNFFVFKQ